MKKYEFTGVTKDWISGKTLHQIRAIKDLGTIKDCGFVYAGDIGGFIEKESNLSHDGNAWVTKNAVVYGDAQVYSDALITGLAMVSGEAKVYHEAVVGGRTHINGAAQICGTATKIKSNSDYVSVCGLAGKNSITAFMDGNEITVVCDDYRGSVDEFESHIFDISGNSTATAEAFELAELIKLHFGKR